MHCCSVLHMCSFVFICAVFSVSVLLYFGSLSSFLCLLCYQSQYKAQAMMSLMSSGSVVLAVWYFTVRPDWWKNFLNVSSLLIFYSLSFVGFSPSSSTLSRTMMYGLVLVYLLVVRDEDSRWSLADLRNFRTSLAFKYPRPHRMKMQSYFSFHV